MCCDPARPSPRRSPRATIAALGSSLDEPFRIASSASYGGSDILVGLVRPQLRGRRLRDDVLRDHAPVRPERAVGLPLIAQPRQPIDLRLVEVLTPDVAAAHVAVERGVADRHLRLVAGRHQHRAELVGDRHQEGAAHARLHVLFGDVARPAGEQRRERLFEAHAPPSRSAPCRAACRSAWRPRPASSAGLRGEARRQHHAAHAFGSERIDGDRRRQRRIDAAGEPEHDAGEAVLGDVVAQPEHSGDVVFALAVVRRAAPPGRRRNASRRRCAASAGRAPASVEGRELNASARSAFKHERAAVEHELVLPADLVDVDERQAAFRSRARPRC